MNIKKLGLSMALAVLLWSCGSDSDGASSLSDRDLPENFAALSDTAKVSALLSKGFSPDSIGVIVCEIGEGKYPGVKIGDYLAIDTYMYEKLGDNGFEAYRMAFDTYASGMPLVSKMKLYTASSLGDLDRMGYELGLEYVNQVIEKKLTIGQVDREVAELRRACDNDEDTFNRFLRGFAAGINTREPGEIPAAIVAEYGEVDPEKLMEKPDTTAVATL